MHVPLDPRSKTLGPLSVLHHGLGRQRCKLLLPRNSQAETKNKLRRGKIHTVAGSDPILSPFFGAKTPYGVPGRSRPQCSTPASSVRLAGCHPQSAATSCHNRLDDLCNL